MIPRRNTLITGGALTALVALLLPSAALAHGIGLEASTKSLPEFVPLGIKHMALGWDHLLFIIGVVVLAGEARRAAKVISIFALGHSITLIVATMAGWQLNPTVVDVAIALSLVYVGALAQLGRPKEWRPVFFTVFAFGLVHGLGLSTRLQDLNIQDGLFGKTIAFNVGVEIGQLAVIAVVFGIGTTVVRAYQHLRNPNVIRYGGALLMVVGLVAAVVLSIPSGDDGDDARADAKPVVAAPKEACTESRINPPTFAGGGHPDLRFQPPGVDVDGVDIVHVLTDGFVALRYQPTLPEEQVAALEQYVLKDDRPIVGAPLDTQKVPLRAVTAYRELSCTRVDLAAVEKFTAQWLADVQAGRAAG